MACRPDEQNLLIVTAEADTGMPARRLAMRATFSPCSASGIAHPRMTSSTSAGSSPGARRNASVMTTAPMSSGRVVRSAPLGAFPIGVRTALTITASFMIHFRKIGEKILERLAGFLSFAVEQVIGAINHDKLFRLFQPAIECPHRLKRAHLVGFPLNEKLWFGAGQRALERIYLSGHRRGHRRRDPNQRRDSVVRSPNLQRDPRSKRKPRGPEFYARVVRC